MEFVKLRPLSDETEDRWKDSYTIEENMRGNVVLRKWLKKGRSIE